MGLFRKLKAENPVFFKGFIGISLLYALAAYFSSGFYHWDEYFQILEFAAYKWGKVSSADLPWEFASGMRPWIQAALLTPLKFLGPHYSVFLARLLMGQTFLLGLLSWYFESREKYQVSDSNYFWGTFLLWFFPTLMVRYSSEAFSGFFILIFMTLYIRDSKCPISHALMGLCAGLAFWSRFQVGFFLFLPLFHIIFIKRQLFLSTVLITAFLGVCGINIAIDSWGYEKFTFTPYNYFYENIILKKTSNFGENAWWDYIKWIATRPTPLIGLPVIGAVLLFLKRNTKDLLGWSILTFYLIHQLVSHKELRFLFPMIGFIPFLLWWFFKEINFNKKVVCSFLILNSLGCLSLFFHLHPLEEFSRITPNALIEVVDGPAPDKLAGGLNARYFFRPGTQFSKEQSNYKFYRHVGKMRADLKEGCEILYTSRPFYKLQTKLDLLKDKKRMWSLIKC